MPSLLTKEFSAALTTQTSLFKETGLFLKTPYHYFYKNYLIRHGSPVKLRMTVEYFL